MDKKLEMSMLFDFYGELLTEKQAEMVDLYYNEDLSLSEIAEPRGISRQGVRDSVVRGERQLLALEEKLGLLARFLSIEKQVGKIKESITEIRAYEAESINNSKLRSMLLTLETELGRVIDEV